jgi:CubicO group peptidase (beta-lactamase class C family)
VVKAGKLDRTETASGCQRTFPLEPDATFQAASLSKPVFARAVLKMAAQEKIDLDAPIVSYLPQGYFHRPYPFLPDFAAKSTVVDDPRMAAVTARIVLNHSSGLPNWSDGPLRFDFSPGDGWQYSGEGYVLLQRATETITQTPLDAWMEKTTLWPLAMSHSSYIG